MSEIKPSITVGNVRITRNVLLSTLADLAKNSTLPAIDKAALNWLVDKANADNVLEVRKPEEWKFMSIHVTPQNEVAEGGTWVDIKLIEKRDSANELPSIRSGAITDGGGQHDAEQAQHPDGQ